jgi:class 3 adenylate cyclase
MASKAVHRQFWERESQCHRIRHQKSSNRKSTTERFPRSFVDRPEQQAIGVNTGTVIAGTLGGPGRLDYTALGDAVNIAQRLQATAVGGEILATVVTVRQSGTDQAEPVGLQQLKGHQELVDTYRIRWAQTSPQGAGRTTQGE